MAIVKINKTSNSDNTSLSDIAEQASDASLKYNKTSNVGESLGNFSEQALDANKFMVGNDIAKNSVVLMNEADSTQDGINKVTSFKHVFGEYADTLLQNVPEENKDYTKTMLKYNGSQALNTLGNNAIQQNNNVANQEFNKTFAVNMAQMNTAAQKGDADAALTFHGQLNQLLNGAEEANWVNSKQKSLMKQQIDINLHTNRVLGEYKSAQNQENGDKFLDNFKGSSKWNNVFMKQDK